LQKPENKTPIVAATMGVQGKPGSGNYWSEVMGVIAGNPVISLTTLVILGALAGLA